MKLIYAAIIATTSATASASDVDCLTRIMYQESRGESLEGVIAVGQAAVNRSEAQGKTICKIQGVDKGQPKKSLVEYYRAIAVKVINDKFPAVVKTADSWNTGTLPRQPGKVERIIGNHVFYTLAAKGEK